MAIIGVENITALAAIGLAVTSIPVIHKIMDDRHTRRFSKPGHCDELKGCCVRRLRALFPSMTDEDVAHLRAQSVPFREETRRRMAERYASGQPFDGVFWARSKPGQAPSVKVQRNMLILRGERH
jgi:hypothetical protein